MPHVQWPVIGFSRHFWAGWDLAPWPTKNWHAFQSVMGILDIKPWPWAQRCDLLITAPTKLCALQKKSFNFVGHCALHFKALPCNNQLEVVRCQFTSRSVFFFCVCVSSTQGKSQSDNDLVINIQRCLTKNSGIHHLHHVSMASWTSWFGVAADSRQRTRVGSRKSTQAFDEAKNTALLAATTRSRD